MSEQAVPATRTVRSSDGTTIAYQRCGVGPPVILVRGALTSALRSFPSFVPLAAALSPAFTVHTYDRRGRGDSGDTAPYSVGREVEDLQALIAVAGGAAAVHGFSSGAVLAVEAAARGAAITKLTLFEPPVPAGEPDPASAAERGELLAAGRRGEVVEQFVTGVGLPAEAIAGLRQTPEWPQLEATAHTLAYDDAITGDRTLWTQRARSVRVPALVLDSDASPEHLRAAARAAAKPCPPSGARPSPAASTTHPGRSSPRCSASF